MLRHKVPHWSRWRFELAPEIVAVSIVIMLFAMSVMMVTFLADTLFAVLH